MTRSKHRFVLLGYGFWGKLWARAIAGRPDCELAALVARSPETMAQARAEMGLRTEVMFTDFRRAFAEVPADAAVIVLPPALHHQAVLLALETGLHILSEKPLAASWGEAVDIARAAAGRPAQRFMVTQTRRWSDHIQAVKKFLDAGRLGRLDSVRVDHRVQNRHPGWRECLEFPVLEDMAVHHFDALRFVTGREPVRVFAQSWNPAWSWYQGQASSAALIEFSGGLHASYFGSWATVGEQTTWEGRVQIVGEGGSLDLADESTLRFYPARPKAKPAISPRPRQIAVRPLPQRGIDYALNEFCAALGENREPECNLADNIRTYALACAAVASCRTGRAVELASLLGQLPPGLVTQPVRPAS